MRKSYSMSQKDHARRKVPLARERYIELPLNTCLLKLVHVSSLLIQEERTNRSQSRLGSSTNPLMHMRIRKL